MDRHSAMLRALARSVPSAFLRRTREVLTQVYAEAYSRTYGDPLFGPRSPEAHDLIGQERHAIFQAKLPQIAKECGLACAALLNPRSTSTYRVVRSGRFMITASAVRSPKDHPRFALFRKQLSNVNTLLQQRVLGFMPLSEVQADDVGTFNAIIIHGANSRNPKEVGFIHMGIPSPRRQNWMFCEPIKYIIEAQLADIPKVAAETLADRVHPKRRQNRRSEGGRE